MNPHRITRIGTVATLALAGTSSAAFVDVAATVKTVTTLDGISLDVFRLYATVDHFTDQIAAVGGTPLSPQVLESGGSGFWQKTMGGPHFDIPLHYNFVVHPDLAYDSFFTIGVPQAHLGTPTLPTFVTFNLTDFNGS
ncbi:MAG: hypothetical protein ACYTGP_11510, partial [Planctomycetota bacterium]